MKKQVNTKSDLMLIIDMIGDSIYITDDIYAISTFNFVSRIVNQDGYILFDLSVYASLGNGLEDDILRNTPIRLTLNDKEEKVIEFLEGGCEND